MKWCWSRLPGGIVTWEAYELFKIGEQGKISPCMIETWANPVIDSNTARDAFATFIPISVANDARTKIIFDFFDLMAATARQMEWEGSNCHDLADGTLSSKWTRATALKEVTRLGQGLCDPLQRSKKLVLMLCNLQCCGCYKPSILRIFTIPHARIRTGYHIGASSLTSEAFGEYRIPTSTKFAAGKRHNEGCYDRRHCITYTFRITSSRKAFPIPRQ
jgi:hypothetical protein